MKFLIFYLVVVGWGLFNEFPDLFGIFVILITSLLFLPATYIFIFLMVKEGGKRPSSDLILEKTLSKRTLLFLKVYYGVITFALLTLLAILEIRTHWLF